jgi:hypothetical protein
MGLRSALVVLSVLGVLAAAACDASAPTDAKSPQPSGHFANWASYHGGALRHGFARTMPPVKGRLRIVKRLNLDGAVYASPLVVNGTTIVATENDTVYAFGPHFGLRWKRHLGSPSPQSQRPCGDIDPLGITGTPVYDPSNDAVFVAPEISGNPPRHQLVKLSFTNGKVLWRRTLDLRGVGSAAMQERGALALDRGRVYVPFGGLDGDCGAYKGRVIGRLASTGGHRVEYTVPTAREAGIWSTPGPAVDQHGHLYVSVGNGASVAGDRYDHSDSVLELSSRLRLVSSFSPRSWRTDNSSDLDLGSQGPAVVGKWVFIDGKSGRAYVLHRDHLGGIGGQAHIALVGASFGGTAVRGDVVYVPCVDGVRALRIGSTGRIHILWHASSSITGSPVVGGGRVWSLDPDAGVLHALGLVHGASRHAVAVGQTSRFATPAIYGRDLYVPTLTGLTVVSTS